MAARSFRSSAHARGSRPAAGVLAALHLLAGSAAAHDHWIAPSSFHPALGERLDLRLCVGHPSQFEEQPRDPRRIVRFELLGAGDASSKPIVGLDGRSPAGFFTTRTAGNFVLVYESNHSAVEIEPEKYARYLEEEGLTSVLAERKQRDETAQPGRDAYLRCDKTLVRIGDAPAGAFDRALGLPIELVLETDPRDAAATELVLRLEYQQKPLADHQVKLMHLDEPFTITLARTDADGHVRFPRTSGRWVASTVQQRRADPEQKLPGDWESFWASLAFELPAR
jgi:uncharacterized GH25 family protein